MLSRCGASLTNSGAARAVCCGLPGTGTASVIGQPDQFFQAAGFGRDAGRLNAHYGHRPGFKVYTHLSDRYGPFYAKLIAATAR